MPKQILSEPQPCPKCSKKYGPELTDWTPCNNCSWTTKETPKVPPIQKQCSVCAKSLNFLEPEPDKYLCSKKACMWHYLSNKEK